jgi:hypothetical protein
MVERAPETPRASSHVRAQAKAERGPEEPTSHA